MLLKRIQLSGFKSFADKIVIGLEKGITGIVGPNGSGKSNVIDAVRWVMGEQNTKTLRGKVATDIIFSGSAKRKALSMAEVSLVFDNSQESNFCPPEYRHEPEIVLTRRLYIDGQREYLINKKPCRLKDLVNFFTLSGLGGKSYSMIQQGAVERILNAKPEDIRVILEEAAGTIIYKMKRDETLKRFENTQENLSRIDDIISELDRQHSSLKIQVEKARKWNEMSNELKEKDLNLSYYDYKSFNDILKKSEGSISDEKNKEAEIMANLASIQIEYEEVQEELNLSDPDIQILHEKISAIREDIGRAESNITHGEENVLINKKRLAELEQSIEEDNENLKIIEHQADAALEEVELSKKKTQELQAAIDSFQDEVDEVEEMFRSYEGKKEDLEEELRSIDRLLDNNGLKTENINRERQKLAKEILILEERKNSLESTIRETKKILEEKENKVEENKSGLKEYIDKKEILSSDIEKRQTKISELSSQRDSLKDEYWEIKSRYNSLVEVENKSGSVSNDLKKIFEKDPTLQESVVGIIGDFLEFNKEKSSELSLLARNSIEKWLECVLIKNIDDLNRLSRISKQCGTGIIPVRVVRDSFDYKNNDFIKRWQDNVEAVSLKEFFIIKNTDEKTKRLVEIFLEELFYLANINIEQEDIEGLPNNIVVFSAQGIVVKDVDSFLISGNSSGVLSYKEELENLKTQLKQKEMDLASVQSNLDELDQKQSEDSMSLSEVENFLRNQNQDSLDILAEFQSVKQVYENKVELIEQNDLQLNNLKEADRQLVLELEEQGEKRIHLASEQDRIHEEMSSLDDENEEIQERKQVVFKQHEKRKQELAKAEGILLALENSSNRTHEQMERVQQVLDRKYNDKNRMELEIEEAIQAKNKAESEIQGLIEQREVLEEELATKREENAVIIEKSRKLETLIRKLNEELKEIQKKCSSKDLEMERLRIALETITQQVEEKYNLNISELDRNIPESFNRDQTQKDVKSLRTKIDNLGAINMMAIEEYEQLTQRQKFLETQKDEIVRSILVIQDALEEIEEVSKNKFVQTFERVNTEFSSLFPILFPGGEGRLELTTPMDPLNSGVEILARLPGKKMQMMSLLSGGEKSLTAISLIFALLKTKPTPFCFLDEVDAPLDEANVGRFNNVLEVLSDRFQFIVITHNRRTMEIFDTLFGVTMQEPGVSKIVGVDMKQDIPPHLQKAFKDEKTV